MSAPTLAVVAAGAMGAAVARRFTTAGCTVLTNLEGRSAATRARAVAAGMQDVPMRELAARSRWVLSILPPSDALAFATRYRDAYAESLQATSGNKGAVRAAFADCNAVSPETVKKIAALFVGSEIGFVDAGIIGGPPRDGYDPVFYASAEPEDAQLLDDFVGLNQWGLKVSPLKGEGAGVGDASALKMSYAGIGKGITGLCTAMILGKHQSHSLCRDEALTSAQPHTHHHQQLRKRFFMRCVLHSQPFCSGLLIAFPICSQRRTVGSARWRKSPRLLAAERGRYIKALRGCMNGWNVP